MRPLRSGRAISSIAYAVSGAFANMPRNADGKTIAKGDLPQKVCPVCGRPFSWRRKWARDWDNVKFCSDRCRAAGP
jgi:hypothetical protein